MRWIAVALLSLLSMPAMADQPVDGALGFQPAATQIAERIHSFHSILLVIITLIVILVMALLLYVILRHNEKANPVPSKFSHNTTIEIAWTLAPVIILMFVAFFSFRELYYQDVFPDVDEVEVVNIKAQGNQWNWTYTYTDVIVDDYPMEFVSNPIHRGFEGEPDGTFEAPRNLAVDLPLVVPVDTVVRVQTAASDVIHSFAVPAFGVKVDAVPGRLNELWFRVEETGTYFGQCSELCGKDHAFMPIEIHVVSQSDYEAWLERAQGSVLDAREFLASLSEGAQPVQLASAQ
ncbi:cytochrome c oxidase subunit II [Ponticaulis sp.]|uniref:cytochrome c oxidase subunit II n=1 Tax=Ponticaulis sp. TaxID=2020902 RepID=UPI0025CD7341|nr:cytochrome c oxidase subunit II [Ponticaulis sp.]